jgi:soluble lytic murein transglycosylase-like protein
MFFAPNQIIRAHLPCFCVLKSLANKKDTMMKKLFIFACLMLAMSQAQAISQANDREELYAVIMGNQPKIDKSATRNVNGKRTSVAKYTNSQNSDVGSGGLRAMVTQIARQNGVPPHIAHGVVMVESRYNCGAYNRSGASGIMQVLPNTARSVGVHGSLRNCSNGITAGIKYLKLALNKGGYGCSGISLYERGLYARPGCTAYGRKVMAHAQGA